MDDNSNRDEQHSLEPPTAGVELLNRSAASSDRLSHQTQLRRQAQAIIIAPTQRLPDSVSFSVERDAAAVGLEPNGTVAVYVVAAVAPPDADAQQQPHAPAEQPQQQQIYVAPVSDRIYAPVLRQDASPAVNPYYEGQRLALADPFMDPELAQPSSSPVNVSSGWSVVDSSNGSTPPCARSLHSGAVLNGSLYVFGGYNGQARVNDFHAFSFADRRWSPVLASANSGRPPSPRDRHISVVFGSSFYVFGGFDGTSRTNDFFGFDVTSMTWREVIPRSGRPPSERHSHAAVVHNTSMYVFGGYDGSYKSDLLEFDFSLSKWSVVPAAGRRPRARYRATCVVHKNQMLLFGGHDGTRHLSDTHIFDFETRIWTALVTDGTPPIPRDSHVSAVWNGSMYIFGGSSGSAMNDLHELQLPSKPSSPAKWRQVKSSSNDLPGHRFCHVAAVFQDSLYIFGGYDGSERLNDFIRFDFAAYDLSFEVPPSSLIADMRNLVDDDTMSDITFIVEDQPVYAHKLILMRCSYFRALFLGDMRESKLSTIRIEQVRHSIFLSVLEYLYTDKLRINLDSAMELFEAADLFMIPRLKTMCEKRMLQSITVDTAATIFLAADMHTANSLRRKALKYIMSHFEEVSKTEAFEEMGRSNMELVFEILRNR